MSHMFTAALALTFVAVLATSATAAILPTNGERKCLGKLGKLGTKLAATVAKETARCRDSDIDGSAVGACPNAGNLDKISIISAKLVDSATSLCKSVCSVSPTVECVSDALCPPLASGINERCTAGAADLPFEMTELGFPGPYCEAAIGGPIRNSQDIGECTSEVAEGVAEGLIDLVYGSLNNASTVSADAANCLGSISKSVQKLASTTAKSVIKCRDAINKGKTVGDPKVCATADAKAASKIATAEQKVRDAVLNTCSVTELAELDICGAGVGGIATILDAQNCLVGAGHEVGDSSEVPAERLYSPVSIVDAAYPPAAVCGDNSVNQIPNKALLVGEECDGSDDSACSGECLPPGDLFECTCGDRPRMRAFADGPSTDSDAGWTGNSFDQSVADQSGYIMDLSNCDCGAFTDADCTGSSTDSICDVDGIQTPFCSWDATHSIRCDTLGNLNGKDTDDDCKICDEFAINAGAGCTDSTDCQAQCYDGAGVPTGACNAQGDCAVGEVCRGRCDDTQTCVITPDGAPLPVAAAGAAVCNVQLFREGVSGTRNIVTGENAINFKLFSLTHLGERVTRPCPVCGGFCVGGAKDLEVCEGRCETSGDPCRFDTDCPGIDEVCSDQSPECPGGFCQLQLVCGTNPGGNETVNGEPCAIDYGHQFFGTVSNDCLPASGLNITGEGFRIDHAPTGSELKTLPFSVPCTQIGFELFDCPCPSDGGQPTQPNACTPACDAGAELGTGCANGVGAGEGTTCALGGNAGKLCDEDSDCPGGTCSDNPTHCTGDPSFERNPCTTNVDCGVGTCGDACPSGRCVPLCLPELGDPEDGVCAAGPARFSCDSEKFGFLCTQASAEAGCAATCSVSATPCDSIEDCPTGETCAGSCENARDCEAGTDGTLGTSDDFLGAGNCIAKTRGCNLNPIMVEGGDTLNGNGTSTDYLRSSIWCFGRTQNGGVNTTSGFGGPGVIRERGTNVMNTTSIP
jgi:hypothetical protein